jgi:two-component system cell cycle sensor histidine kinase/response regulator CckA
MPAIQRFDEASHDIPDTEQDAPRILVVDADLDLRNVLTGCLLELGYAASSAANGLDATRLVANALHDNRPYDAVILDVSDRHGLQSIDSFHAIRRLDDELPVIATSTWPHSTWLMDYDSFGFAAALPKPWRFVELAMLLKRIVRRLDPKSSTRIKTAD